MGKKNKQSQRVDTNAKASPANNPFADLLVSQGLVDPDHVPECEPDEEPPPRDPSDGVASLRRVVLRMERKGRGGKTVTIVEGLDEMVDDGRETLARELRKAMGTGTTIEGDTIVVQGDLRERLESWFRDAGARQVVRG